MASPIFNLQQYCEESVVIDRKEKRLVLSVVLPVVEKLVKVVNKNSNDVFGRQLVHVGSYYQGLKTQQANEFDYNVPLLGLNVVWSDGDGSISYGFQGIDDEETERKTPRQGLKIVDKPRRLKPSINCLKLKLGDHSLKNYGKMAYKGDLVPYLVKMTFKDLLSDACRTMDGVTMCQQAHGPALMVKISKKFSSLLPHDVTNDFAPVIQSHLPYPQHWGWPQSDTRKWLSVDHIESVRSKGVGLVAKDNLFWTLSFAEMEKELTQHADKSDECRKKVHRIMKVIFKNQWRHGASVSTYELKNAWLLYCEYHTEDWKEKDYLGSRFVECTQLFYNMLMKKNLPQYFRRENNLLDGKKRDDIAKTASNIHEFLLKHRFLTG